MSKGRRIALMVVFIITLVVMSIGTAYAYFTAMRIASVTEVAEVTSATTDIVTYDGGEPLNIHASPENFNKFSGSLYDETIATVNVKLGSDDQVSKYYYDVMLVVADNDFIYSTENSEAELILTITDPEGNVINQANGLEFKTSNGVSGLDITEAIGEYKIIDNFELVASKDLTQEWKIKLTFVNHNESQDENMGKEFNGEVRLIPEIGEFGTDERE